MEEQEIKQYQQRRENFLTIFLTVLAGAGILFFLIFVTGGFFIYVMLGLVVITIFGFLHYLLWGRLFSQQVAGEREEEEARARAEAEEESLPKDKHQFRRR